MFSPFTLYTVFCSMKKDLSPGVVNVFGREQLEDGCGCDGFAGAALSYKGNRLVPADIKTYPVDNLVVGITTAEGDPQITDRN